MSLSLYIGQDHFMMERVCMHCWSSSFIGIQLLAVMFFGNYGFGSFVCASEDVTYAQLEETEQYLQNELRDLSQQGYGPSDFLRILSSSNSGDERQRQLHEWVEKQQKFQKEFDQHILTQQSYFLNRSMRRVSDLATQALEGIQGDSLKLAESFMQLKLYYKNHNESVQFFASKKDHKRINSFRKFYEEYKRFLVILDVKQASKSTWIRKMTLLSVKRAVKHPKIFGSLLRPKLGKPIESDLDVVKPSTDLTRKEGRSLRKIFGKMGVQVKLEGKNHIPSTAQRSQFEGKVDEINIFAFQHGNGVLDELVKAHIPIGHYMIVWAIKIAPLPSVAIPLLDRSPSVIPVGGSQTTFNAAIDRIKNGNSNNIAIHPQGELNIFNEVMPVHKNFSHSFIKDFIQLKYKVNLVPVSSRYAPNFAGGDFEDIFEEYKDYPVTIKIGKALDWQQLLSLSKLEQGYNSLNLYLRLFWLSEATTDESQMMGMLRSSHISQKMNSKFDEPLP